MWLNNLTFGYHCCCLLRERNYVNRLVLLITLSAAQKLSRYLKIWKYRCCPLHKKGNIWIMVDQKINLHHELRHEKLKSLWGWGAEIAIFLLSLLMMFLLLKLCVCCTLFCLDLGETLNVWPSIHNDKFLLWSFFATTEPVYVHSFTAIILNNIYLGCLRAFSMGLLDHSPWFCCKLEYFLCYWSMWKQFLMLQSK